MKKITVAFLFVSIYFSSCINDAGEPKSLDNSLNTASKSAKYTDSFISIEQNKIIGDLKFGLTKKEADNKIDNFNKNNRIGSGYYIGDFKYDKINGDYYKGSLYKIRVSGSYTDSGNQQADAIAKLVEKKYGKGKDDTSHHAGGFDNVISRKWWYVGKKKIEIWLWECTNKEMNIHYGGSKHVDLEIYLQDIYYKIENEEIENDGKQKDERGSVF